MSHWLRGTSKRSLRRGWPIHGYIGPNGGGKSTAAVWDTLPSLDAGRHVLSTVRLLDFRNPRPCDDPTCDSPNHAQHMAAHPLWIPWHSWSQLLEVEHTDVLADEVTGVASSRESSAMPAVIANALVQLRRRDVVLRWTAPSWSRADLIIRECTQAATLCTGFLPVRVKSDDSDDDRMWRHRRLFRWLTYDAALLDELNTGRRENLDRWVFDLHWGPGSEAFQAFDTFDAVTTIGHVSDAGRCMTCGGRRTAPACSCSDYDRPARRGRTAAGAPDAEGSGVRRTAHTASDVVSDRSDGPSRTHDHHLTHVGA